MKILDSKKLNDEEKLNNINIMNTILEEENQQLIYDKFLENIDTNMYISYRNLVKRNDVIDSDYFNFISEKIKDIWFIDICILYNINLSELTYSFSIILDILDSIHFDLKNVIIISLKNNKKIINDVFENIELIVKNSRGKLRSFFKLLDIETIYKIIQKCFLIYEVEIKNELIMT